MSPSFPQHSGGSSLGQPITVTFPLMKSSWKLPLAYAQQSAATRRSHPSRYGAAAGTRRICTGHCARRDGAEPAGASVASLLIRCGPPGPAPCPAMGIPGAMGAAGAFGSTNALASRFSILMASAGQAGRHFPSPSQKSSRTRRALPSMSFMAPSSQASTHRPQPVHLPSSMTTTSLNMPGGT